MSCFHIFAMNFLDLITELFIHENWYSMLPYLWG